MPTACRCGTLEQSKREGGYHRSIDPLEVRAVQNVLMPLVGFHDAGSSGDDESKKQKRSDDHVFNPSEKMHRGLIRHSGARNVSFLSKAISLVRACDIFVAPA